MPVLSLATMAMVAGVEEKANVVVVKLIMVRMLNTNFMEFSDLNVVQKCHSE
jgi:hypothetical protein